MKHYITLLPEIFIWCWWFIFPFEGDHFYPLPPRYLFKKIQQWFINYLEPPWPLFLKVNPPKQGLNFNQNRGHLNSIGIYLSLFTNLKPISSAIGWDLPLEILISRGAPLDSHHGQISSRPKTHDPAFGPQNVAFWKGNPRFFEGNLGWWNVIIWPDIRLDLCLGRFFTDSSPSRPTIWEEHVF